jgi:hypothetical protein
VSDREAVSQRVDLQGNEGVIVERGRDPALRQRA